MEANGPNSGVGFTSHMIVREADVYSFSRCPSENELHVIVDKEWGGAGRRKGAEVNRAAVGVRWQLYMSVIRWDCLIDLLRSFQTTVTKIEPAETGGGVNASDGPVLSTIIPYESILRPPVPFSGQRDNCWIPGMSVTVNLTGFERHPALKMLNPNLSRSSSSVDMDLEMYDNDCAYAGSLGQNTLQDLVG
ncbi:hypothetical protein ElyMa_004879100 [Elysia marginata]|uniref:SRCR domain-containing protein n=1 Tax=Elysia marginata TaxID=1093978 RepID=A0AAV4IRQ2_9GAST|nr:hypothetical protein ElyMa_004879100 [Elysia marginata]